MKTTEKKLAAIVARGRSDEQAKIEALRAKRVAAEKNGKPSAAGQAFVDRLASAKGNGKPEPVKNGNGKPEPRVLPANPLKKLEGSAEVKAAAAKAKTAAPAKATAAAAEPAAKRASLPKPKLPFTRRFARVFQHMLGDGYDLTIAADEKTVSFENKKLGVVVDIVNPNKQWASETAAYSGTKKGKPFAGQGRDALAKELGVKQFSGFRR